MKQESYRKIDWDEQFKVRVRRNASKKHEIIKLLIVLNILEKYKKNLRWIRIYTEYPTANGRICDVYFENVRTHEIVAYEIQKNISGSWLDDTKEAYDNWDRIYFKTDWVLVKESEFPDNIDMISDKIKKEII